MSRTYALALIFTAVAVIASLFYLQHRLFTERNEAMLAYAEGVHERAIALEVDNLYQLAMNARDHMEDLSKMRFRPILPFIEQVYQRRDNYLEKAKKQLLFNTTVVSNQEDFFDYHDAQLDALAAEFATFLQLYGEQMDMRKAEIEAMSSSLKKEIEKVRAPRLKTIYSGSNSSVTQGLLTLDFLHIVTNMTQYAFNLSGGRTICGGGWYFPVFVPEIINPQKGEIVKARVSIGSYSTSLDSENVVLTVGNDTLKMKSDGVADYEFVPKKRGEQTIDIHFAITNPLTGEVITNEGAYIMYVR